MEEKVIGWEDCEMPEYDKLGTYTEYTDDNGITTVANTPNPKGDSE